MKYKHFDEIEPSHNTNFTMLYFFVMQTGIGNTQNKWWQTYLSADMVASQK